VKVIFENSYLTDAEKVAGYQAAEAAGAAYVKDQHRLRRRGSDGRGHRADAPERVVRGADQGGRRRAYVGRAAGAEPLGATRFGATATAAIIDDLEERRGERTLQ